MRWGREIPAHVVAGLICAKLKEKVFKQACPSYIQKLFVM